MTIRVLKQDTRSNCGQTCVAMVAGISIRKAVTACGTRGRTTYARVRWALKTFGWRLAEREKYRGQVIKNAMIRLKTKHGSHWVLARDGDLYEPSQGLKWTNVDQGLRSLFNTHGLRPTTFAGIERNGNGMELDKR